MLGVRKNVNNAVKLREKRCYGGARQYLHLCVRQACGTAPSKKVNAAMSVSALSGHKKTLVSQLAEKRVELAKLKVTKAAIDAQAEKSPDRVALLTFLFLAAQWAVLFNWVFITFDWNLVEPITYFIGYTVVWLSIVHYYATGQEYTYDNVRQALADRKRRSLMKKANFDLDAFLKLDADVKTLEADVAALENID
eukprot:PhM_4_TR3407/c1_g1_i1/m.83332/K20858/MCU; calcium uniporter protein, mitochondrial